MKPDLLNNPKTKTDYSAADIEVLEGLEPVRRRPGMYIGGTDERALHHLAAEILDNAMDEAVAGHANRIEVHFEETGHLCITDNGRGIPIENHPKFPSISALQVIFTTLHSGGKFSGKIYETSGGLHGVGSAVVNALSAELHVEVARERTLYRQEFQRGAPQGKLKKIGPANWRGTKVRFIPDEEIFGAKGTTFKAASLYRLARSKAYLYKGVTIIWRCAANHLEKNSDIPEQDTLHFPGGLLDYLENSLENRVRIVPTCFSGQADFPDKAGRMEWAIAWPQDGDGFCSSYCNTIPTPEGGTHVLGLRSALLRGLRAYADMANYRKASVITGDDIINGAGIMFSVFIRDPQFQGQTKEKLASTEATKLIDSVLKDHFEHWLSGHPAAATLLLDELAARAEERLRKANEKDMARKSPTRRLRLPGKLVDCARNEAAGTEIFLVEGDSAGGSAKSARHRETQAILPLRGKILNVASASTDKLRQNQEIADLSQALGCGLGREFSLDKLRYERVIIMTDADVDGAHIAALLMTFFYREMPGIIRAGRLYLAQPPLYRLARGSEVRYARDDAHKEELLKQIFKNTKVDVSRFKGLGEMPAAQLKETTMDARSRHLLRIVLPDIANEETLPLAAETAERVEALMGRKPELRLQFIRENAQFATAVDI